MSTAVAWTEITSTRDLTLFSKFERAFRQLQDIAESRTGTKLRFGRSFLKAVFDGYADTVVAHAIREGRRADLSDLTVQMPHVLAGALLEAFDRHHFGWGGSRSSAAAGVSRAAVDAGGYFILAFCVEYYLFLTYKRLRRL